MFTIPAASTKIMIDYDVNYRIVLRAGSVERIPRVDEHGEPVINKITKKQIIDVTLDDNKMPLVSAAITEAEIIDNVTGLVYITAAGSDPTEAVTNALAKVPTTEKPKTKAVQLIEARIRSNVSGEMSDKDREIEDLKAQLAALEGRVKAKKHADSEGPADETGSDAYGIPTGEGLEAAEPPSSRRRAPRRPQPTG